MITTVIFDMNGVITNDEHYHEAATRKAFAPFGVSITPAVYRQFCLGRTDDNAFQELLDVHAVSAVSKDELIGIKTAHYLRMLNDQVPVYPGAVDLILRMHQHYTLALTTSSTAKEARTVLHSLGLENRFTTVVTAEDVVQGKPHPEPYLLTATRLGVPARECTVIEDSENGVTSAKGAQMTCIAITNTESPERLSLADAIVANYSAISPALINSLA